MDHHKQESLEDNWDRISELPELILSCILSKLTMKDLVQTALLSKRWQIMWQLRRDLIFDIPNMFNLDLPHLCKRDGRMLDREYLDQIIDEFVRRVTQFMLTFPGLSINSFRLTHYAGLDKHASAVECWVAYALARGVQEIDILSSPPLTNCQKKKLTLPIRPFPVYQKERASESLKRFERTVSLKHLYLKNCIFMPPPSFFAAFYYLKTLKLQSTVVSEDFMAYQFVNSPFLEVLCLHLCKLPDHLEIVGPSLHRLEVLDCLHRGTATISAIKLTVFEYRNTGEVMHILSLNAPQLANTFFYTWADDWIPPLISHFSGFAHLENLNLHIFSERMQTMPRSIPILGNLKHLELSFVKVKIFECPDLLWVFLFLKASPLLQKLGIRRKRSTPGYSENKGESERWEPQKFTHCQLKEVEIAGCVGNWYEIEFAIYMLQSVEGLEQMVFNPSRRYYMGAGRLTDDEDVIRLDAPEYWLESGREIVRKKLQDKVPASARLVLL